MPHEDVPRSVGESDGEEEDAAFDVCTTVSRHESIIYRFAWVARRVGTARRSQACADCVNLSARAPLPTLHRLRMTSMHRDRRRRNHVSFQTNPGMSWLLLWAILVANDPKAVLD